MQRVGQAKICLTPALTAFPAGGNRRGIGGPSRVSTPHLATTYDEVKMAFGMQLASSFTNLGNRKNKYFPISHSSCSCNLAHIINKRLIFEPQPNIGFQPLEEKRVIDLVQSSHRDNFSDARILSSHTRERYFVQRLLQELALQSGFTMTTTCFRNTTYQQSRLKPYARHNGNQIPQDSTP